MLYQLSYLAAAANGIGARSLQGSRPAPLGTARFRFGANDCDDLPRPLAAIVAWLSRSRNRVNHGSREQHHKHHHDVSSRAPVTDALSNPAPWDPYTPVR